MALEVTQVHRNLHQRVTWLYLEIEDMFLVLARLSQLKPVLSYF